MKRADYSKYNGYSFKMIPANSVSQGGQDTVNVAPKLENNRTKQERN